MAAGMSPLPGQGEVPHQAARPARRAVEVFSEVTVWLRGREAPAVFQQASYTTQVVPQTGIIIEIQEMDGDKTGHIFNFDAVERVTVRKSPLTRLS